MLFRRTTEYTENTEQEDKKENAKDIDNRLGGNTGIGAVSQLRVSGIGAVSQLRVFSLPSPGFILSRGLRVLFAGLLINLAHALVILVLVFAVFLLSVLFAH
jgi:hypothetical protein